MTSGVYKVNAFGTSLEHTGKWARHKPRD